MGTTTHLLYRRARPEDANAVDALEVQLQEQLQRCATCPEKCRTPSPYCVGAATSRELAAACLPSLAPLALVGAVAVLARFL
jgi:hypothetical protein